MHARRDSSLVIGMLLGGSVAAGAAAVPDGKLELTVRVYDHATVSARSLARAKATAAYVFGTAGLEPAWLEYAPGREKTSVGDVPADLSHVFVMIVPQPPAESAPSSSMFGLAVLREGGHGSHLYVFHDRVARLAREHGLAEGVVLGHVLAHEIGHLLMGSNSHAASGIMSGRWFARELRRMAKGDLLFDPAERARLRAGLIARAGDDAPTITSRGGTLKRENRPLPERVTEHSAPWTSRYP